MLKKDKNGSPEWLSKLPQMAKQLEVSLYRNARSFEEYMDMSTLKQRLQQIAVEVSRKARSQSGDQRDDRRQERSHSSSAYPNPNGLRPDSSGANSPFMGMSSSSQHQSMSSSNRGHVVNMDDINPMASSGSGMSSMGGNLGSSISMGGNMGSGMGGNMGSSMSSNIGGPGYGQQRSMPASNRPSSSAGSSSVPGVGSGSGVIPSQANRNDPEWKVRIRHKQQRLLLLHHSAKCPHEDGRCTVTPHCADMKRLWRHMEGCKDNNCRVSHCFSSRAILSHYRKCKDPSCPACGPVRETVRKSQSRSQQASQNTRMGGRPMGSSTAGSMMGNLSEGSRMMSSSTPSQQHNMMSDPMPSPHVGGFSSQQSMPSNFPPASQQRPPSSQSNMPPPPTGPSGNSSSMQFSTMQSSSQPPLQQQYRSNASSSMATSTPAQPMFSSNQHTSQTAPINSSVGELPSSSQRASPGAMPGSSGSGRRNDSEWQKIRHKQQRLLLLRHASRCQYEPNKCPVTPHCASMKKLWEHIAHCKNQHCNVPHCMSSRYVLSHYRRCKDSRCPACGPVRETIRKSHEKERARGQLAPSGPSSFDHEISRPPQPGDLISDQLDPTSGSMDDASASPEYMHAVKRTKLENTSSMPPSAPALMSSQEPTRPPQAEVAVSEPPIAERQRSAPPEPVALSPAPVETPSAPAETASAPAAKEVAKSASASKGSEDRSLLDSFTIEELTTHLASLNRASQLPPSKLKVKCQEVLKGLQTHQHGWVFNCPVDPEELGLPDYFDIIKKPMDLGTIHKKLDAGAYHDIQDFKADVNLTFDNAMTYNELNSVVYEMAKELKTKFEADWAKMMSQLDAEDRERRQNDRACVLCGCEKLNFEPPVFFCNGINCQSQRIRRNSHFYIGGNNQYFWCNQCYNELDDKAPIELVDLTITKADLKKKKNDEVHEESWVQCDVCERWIHQICGLFNTRQNKEHHSEYCCPMCLLEKRKKDGVPPSPKPPAAAELPRTKLSEWLENHVSTKIKDKKDQLAKEKATT